MNWYCDCPTGPMNFPMTTFPFILLWQEQKRGKEAFTTRGQIWATSIYFWPKIWPQPHPVCVSAGRRMCTSSIAKLKGLLTVRYFKWERLEKTTKTKTSCPVEHFLFNDFCICGFFKMWVSRVLDCSEPAIKNCKLNIQVGGKSELLLSFLLHPFRRKDFPCCFGCWLWCVESEQQLYCIYVRSHYVYTERCEVRCWILDVKQQPCSFP